MAELYQLKRRNQMKQDPSILYNGFRKESGYWYYYNQGSNTKATGWLPLGIYTYYANPSNGQIASGARTISNKRYYFDTRKRMTRRSWLKVGSYFYYFTEDGSAIVNDSREFFGVIINFDQYGRADRTIDTINHCLMQGWSNTTTIPMLNGGAKTLLSRYYDQGLVVSNTTITVDGFDYELDDQGYCQYYINPDDNTRYIGFLDIGGFCFYFDPAQDGLSIRNTTQIINNIECQFYESGVCNKYFDQNGNQQTGFILRAINTTTTNIYYYYYYYDPENDGILYVPESTTTREINGVNYSFTTNGYTSSSTPLV